MPILQIGRASASVKKNAMGMPLQFQASVLFDHVQLQVVDQEELKLHDWVSRRR
jgi:hypothetical protein